MSQRQLQQPLGQGFGFMQFARRVITAAEIAQWPTIPTPITPAPGPDRLIYPLMMTVEYVPGSVAFVNPGNYTLGTFLNPDIAYANLYASAYLIGEGTDFLTDLTPKRLRSGYQYVSQHADFFALDLTQFINRGILFSTGSNAGRVGTAIIEAPGAGYAPGDVLTLDYGAATFTVSSVDGDGGVTGIAMTNAGENVAAGVHDTTTNHDGAGCQLNVTALASAGITGGNGSLIVAVNYNVLQC